MTEKALRVQTKDYARQYAELWPELGPAIERAFHSDEPVLGDAVSVFERRFAKYMGSRECVGVNSGTDALALSLRALGVGPGDEVITAANTFVATVAAIAMVGARPVLVDADQESMLIDVAGIAQAVGPRTRAVIPVHLYGRVCPMDAVRRAAPNRYLIEDAAQSHGARGVDGALAGSYDIAGAFSFHPSKTLGAFGDAGAVITPDPDLAARLRVMRNLGKSTKYEVRELGPNSKLDTLQAVVLGIKLDRLDAWNVRRREIATHYFDRLTGVGDLILPGLGGGQHAFHAFVVRTGRRDNLRRHLRDHGIATSIHYPIPPHLQPLDVDLGYSAGDFPVTERLAREIVSLPISHELTNEEIEAVCDGVQRFFV